MTAVSIVLVNVLSSRRALRQSLAAVEIERQPCDELVFVDAGGCRPPPSWDAHVQASRSSARGDLYAAGFDASRHAFVAFTDSSTEVQPGWRNALVGALASGAGVVGGPVEPGEGRSPISLAGFLVEYGTHAAPPWTSATGDVAANNVAYRRSSVIAVRDAGTPLWKTVVNAALMAAGERPRAVARMRVVSRKTYTFADLTGGRLRHGRLYGSQRSASWSRGRRLVRATSCAIVPVIAYARLAYRLRHHTQLRRELVHVTPLVAIALLLWSVGEAIGYLHPSSKDLEVF